MEHHFRTEEYNMGGVKYEYKQLVASYKDKFVDEKFTPGNDSGDWSLRDPDTGYIYVCPQPGKYVDIAPSWKCIKPENICVCDPDGNLVEDNGLLPTVELPMHLAIYKARPDCNAIVHSHPLYSSVFAVTRENIPLMLAEQALFLGGETRCAKYGLVGSTELADNIVEALGETRNAALLANHGSVILGKNLSDAFVLSGFLEHAAYVAILAKNVGTIAVLDPDKILDPSLL